MSKYSSYKEHQLITENWRRFLAEAEEEVVEETTEDEVLEEDEEGLEEGWDDIKAGASKAWKKVKGGAEDAWDTVATTASDIKHSPTDLGAKYRRKRKSAADEKRQKYADEDAKRAARRAGQEKSRTQDRESRRRETEFKEKHGMSSAEYERQQGVAAKASNRDWLKKGPSAKEKADRQRRKDKDDAGLKNPEHMKTQKSNVAYAGSGFGGRSGLREQDSRMTSADYQKSVRDDRGQSGSQSGVDDVERKALALVQQKVAQAAAAGDIKTGMPARLIKALVKELDKILAKKK